MASRSLDPTSLPAIGARLKLTRQALGFTQATMSKLMGSSTAGQAWENYEAGRRRISVTHAMELCRTCQLTLPWIYQGQMHDLPPHIREEILRRMPPGGMPPSGRKTA
jgi:transcriptional regulator with XRE-family HTH domain